MTIEYLGFNKPVNRLQPDVSVVVTTYQHAAYIRECLDSVLSQETEFSYEVLLGEDDSSDGTRAICIEYAERFPDKVRLFLHDRADNFKIAGRPTGRNNFLHCLRESRGQFLAFCEGDDYWTSTKKIQWQVEALKKNRGAMLCFHRSEYIVEGSAEKGVFDRFGTQPMLVAPRTMLATGGGTALLSAIMIRADLLPVLLRHGREIGGMHGFIRIMGTVRSQPGVAYLPECMSCYRRHSTSSITAQLINTPGGKRVWVEGTLTMLGLVDRYSAGEFSDVIAVLKTRAVVRACASGHINYGEFRTLTRKLDDGWLRHGPWLFMAGGALRLLQALRRRFRGQK